MSSDLLQRLASNVRILREQRGVTREQLAETASVDPQMIKRIEHARANPALVVLSRIACALMISVSSMFAMDASAEPLFATSSAATEVVEPESVGETIKALRKDRKLSRRGLANLLGIRTITLSRYEEAVADARVLSIEPLASAFNISSADFVRAIELRQQQADRSRGGWHSRAEGVQCRLVSSTTRAQLWEFRIAPRTSFEETPDIAVAEEIATAIRGEVKLVANDASHRLRRGGSIALTNDGTTRKFENTGTSTARLLRYQVAM